MEHASQESGKTILFVSHNMGQISALCSKGILLNSGRVEAEGNIQSIIAKYFSNGTEGNESQTEFSFPNDLSKEYGITKIEMLNQKGLQSQSFPHDEHVSISIQVEQNVVLKDVMLGVFFTDMMDKRIFSAQLPISDKFGNSKTRQFNLQIPDSTFIPNTYKFSVGLHIPNIQVIDDKANVGRFEIYDNGSELYKYAGTDVGIVFVKCNWTY
jgi:lipopolysaccharide transport system ATP-binding protein